MCKNCKEIVPESIDHFVSHKILRKNPDPEYYSKEVKRLKVKFRKAYDRRKLREHHLEELRRLSKQLLEARTLPGTFLDQYEAKKINAGLSSTSTYKAVKDMGKIILPSKNILVVSSQIR